MRIGTFTLISSHPALMGIVNATPDSFSDGGRFLDPHAAVGHALKLAEEGADIIDLGGESSRPGAGAVSIDEELRRVLPVIEGIRKRSKVPISIDTTKAAIAEAALVAGADMVNDISAGRFDPAILAVAAKHGVPICLMHMQGEPRTMQVAPAYDDLVGEIRLFLADAMRRAVAAGIARDRIIIDPGIGFGKAPMDNVTLLQRLPDFRELEAPILVGTSKKSFMGKLLGFDVDKRLEGTLATLAVAIEGGAAVLRVHDVASARRFIDAWLLCRA